MPPGELATYWKLPTTLSEYFWHGFGAWLLNRLGPGPGEEVSIDMDLKGAVPGHAAAGLNQTEAPLCSCQAPRNPLAVVTLAVLALKNYNISG